MPLASSLIHSNTVPLASSPFRSICSTMHPTFLHPYLHHKHHYHFPSPSSSMPIPPRTRRTSYSFDPPTPISRSIPTIVPPPYSFLPPYTLSTSNYVPSSDNKLAKEGRRTLSLSLNSESESEEYYGEMEQREGLIPTISSGSSSRQRESCRNGNGRFYSLGVIW